MVAVLLLAVGASACMPQDAKTFLDRTNALRASSGAAPLAEHDVLTAKAERWAQHMAATGSLSHSNLADGLGGLSWRLLGENVGMSSPTADTLRTVHEALAGSAAHRANMVNRRFTHMGVGVATSRDGRVWVAEVFAQL